MKLNVEETLLLLAFASKVCEFGDQLKFELDTSLPPEKIMVDQIQLNSLKEQAEKVLKRFDADNPGVVALPHDGIPWRDR